MGTGHQSSIGSAPRQKQGNMEGYLLRVFAWVKTEESLKFTRRIKMIGTMEKFYGVRTWVYDNGKVKAKYIGYSEADEMPETAIENVDGCEVYTDWFYSFDEAMGFIEDIEVE